MPPSQRWTEGQEAQLLLGVIKDTIKGIKIPTALWKDLAPKLGKSVSATVCKSQTQSCSHYLLLTDSTSGGW